MKKSFNKKTLQDLYEKEKLSVSVIAKRLGCSQNKVNYWLKKYGINKRSISEAIYLKNNPKGDPFLFNQPKNVSSYFIYGLGLGLFWGEGNKKDRHSVRLGNSDPKLIRYFIKFLKEIYNIDERRLRFGIQVFNDVSSHEALLFWSKELSVDKSQFQKVVITPTRGTGSYKKKSKHGVLTVYFYNKKLRDTIMGAIEGLK